MPLRKEQKIKQSIAICTYTLFMNDSEFNGMTISPIYDKTEIKDPKKWS